MAFPKLKNKHLEKSIYTVEDWAKYKKEYRELAKKGAPKNVILCFSRKFLKSILHSFDTKKISGPYGDFYAIKKSDFGVIGHFGIGAPVSSIIMKN